MDPVELPALDKAVLINPIPPVVEEQAVAELHRVPVFHPVPPTLIVPVAGVFQIDEITERAAVPP